MEAEQVSDIPRITCLPKMRTLITFLFIAVAVCFSHPGNPDWLKNNNLEDDEWSYVPQVDGTFRFMSHKQAKLEYELSPKPRSELVVLFQLFTRLNPDEPQYVRENKSSTLVESNFNPRHPTRIVTHGWLNDANSDINIMIRPALLDRGDYNVFIVDWGTAANTWNYLSARYSVSDAGKKIAGFIEFLHKNGGMKFEDLTLIGHSLGAHACGIAAKEIKSGRVNTIFGLDPALPLFSYKIPEERLDPEDADYTQTIHTNGGYLSFHQPLGKASFYPNWGSFQPGCGFDTTGACAHRRSYEYYTESLHKDNSFIPFDCFEYHGLMQKSCVIQDKNVRMGGEPADYGYVKGVYYVPTNSEEPYGLGIISS